MNFLKLMMFAAENTDGNEGCSSSNIFMYIIIGVLIVAMLIIPTFSNKKRSKQVNELHNSVEVGDTIKTIGGIVGRVVALNQISPVEREMVIETGIEGKTCTLVLDMQALYQNLTKIAQNNAQKIQAEKTQESAPSVEEVAQQEQQAEEDK